MDISFYCSWSSICTYVTKKDPDVYVWGDQRAGPNLLAEEFLLVLYIHQGSNNKILYDINTSNMIPIEPLGLTPIAFNFHSLYDQKLEFI